MSLEAFLQIPPPKRADPPPPVHHEDEDPAQHSTSPGSPPPSHPLTQKPQGNTADSTDGRRSTQDLRPRHLRPRRLHPAAFLGSGFRVTHDQDSTSQSPTQPPIQVHMEPEPSIQVNFTDALLPCWYCCLRLLFSLFRLGLLLVLLFSVYHVFSLLLVILVLLIYCSV